MVLVEAVLVSNKNGNICQCSKNDLSIDIFFCTNLIAIAAHLLQTQVYCLSGRSVVKMLNRVQTGR